MDQVRAFFVNWQALAIALGAFVLLGLIRQLGTKKDKDGQVLGGFAQNKWFQAFLPLYPYVLAVLMTFCAPLPEAVVALGKKSFMAKILFGLYAGWLSGYSFQLVKKVLENIFSVNFDAQPATKVELPPSPPSPPSPPPIPGK